MKRVLQTHPLVVLGLNVWMGTAAGADELMQKYLLSRNVVQVPSHGPISLSLSLPTYPLRNRGEDQLQKDVVNQMRPCEASLTVDTTPDR